MTFGDLAVKEFSELFNEDYNTQLGEWGKTLKVELKLEDISSKIVKNHIDLGPVPTLTTEVVKSFELGSATSWKKASQTYLRIDKLKIISQLTDDLESGVRLFFINKDSLEQKEWDDLQEFLAKSNHADEIEIYLLGQKRISSKTELKVIDELEMIIARDVFDFGGHNVLELAVLAAKLVENLPKNDFTIAVSVDSHFFKNIAKIRALKLIALKIFKEAGITSQARVVTLSSYRDWTLYERYSNILRNNTQVASAYIAGADAVQSSGYQSIFEVETDDMDALHSERSLRIARNTSHILALESMLGIVEDAAYGSFHLENLSHKYAESAWLLMQQLLKLAPQGRKDFISQEVIKTRAERSLRVQTRKDVKAGLNDFPDGKEFLQIHLNKPSTFRVAREFEELRLKVESLKSKPVIQIIMKGSLAELSNRLSFIKNYFELIGLEVKAPSTDFGFDENDILVLCAKDEDYFELISQTEMMKNQFKFVAGKVESSHFQMIHAGQNIFQVLSSLVTKLAGNK